MSPGTVPVRESVSGALLLKILGDLSIGSRVRIGSVGRVGVPRGEVPTVWGVRSGRVRSRRVEGVRFRGVRLEVLDLGWGLGWEDLALGFLRASSFLVAFSFRVLAFFSRLFWVLVRISS